MMESLALACQKDVLLLVNGRSRAGNINIFRGIDDAFVNGCYEGCFNPGQDKLAFERYRRVAQRNVRNHHGCMIDVQIRYEIQRYLVQIAQ
jgi:hypothetical protein